jgi:6-phosphogluconolactonase (cycloisomerase 2 family)
LAGSCEIKQGNEVHVIDFDEEKGEISSLIFAHQGEINYITSSPSEENTLMTCSSTRKFALEVNADV